MYGHICHLYGLKIFRRMRRQRRSKRKGWRPMLRKNQRNLHWSPSPPSFLMSNLGMMKLTWKLWRKLSDPSAVMVCSGELVSSPGVHIHSSNLTRYFMQPNWSPLPMVSGNSRLAVLLKMTKCLLTGWLRRFRTLRIWSNLLILLLSTRSKTHYEPHALLIF